MLSAAILAAGVLALIGFLVPASVGIWGVILGITLAILGVGLLIGTRYGRARWLLWLAIPLAFITFATVSASNFVADNPNWDRWTATADGRRPMGRADDRRPHLGRSPPPMRLSHRWTSSSPPAPRCWT